MDRSQRKYLFDIQQAAAAINTYVAGISTLDEYEQQRMVTRAVERELMIIGEAMNKLLKISPEVPITSARQVVNLRNLLVHAYDDTDQEIIWGVVQQHLPLLLEEVDKLMAE